MFCIVINSSDQVNSIIDISSQEWVGQMCWSSSKCRKRNLKEKYYDSLFKQASWFIKRIEEFRFRSFTNGFYKWNVNAKYTQ